jgi:uncharacterized protein (UPF0335 family)
MDQDHVQELQAQIERLRHERDTLRADLTRLYEAAQGYRAAQQAAKAAIALAELGDAQDKEDALRKVAAVIAPQARLFATLDAFGPLNPIDAGTQPP